MTLDLYSGQTTQMEFYFQGFQKKLINRSIAKYLPLDTNSMQSFMHTRGWFIKQLGVPIHSEQRYLKKIGLYLCNCLENKDGAGITIYERNGFNSKQDTLNISCFDLE